MARLTLRIDQELPKPYRSGEAPDLGDHVRIADEEIDTFTAVVQTKIRGRTGFIKGFTYPSSMPLITFPAIGRKKEYSMGQARSSWLVLGSRATTVSS